MVYYAMQFTRPRRGMPENTVMGGKQNEACEDAQRRDSEAERRPRRLRRVPDLLPVCLQDLLHRCQPEVRISKDLDLR